MTTKQIWEQLVIETITARTPNNITDAIIRRFGNDTTDCVQVRKQVILALGRLMTSGCVRHRHPGEFWLTV